MCTKLGPPCETCWSNYEQTNCSSIWRQSSWLWTQKCGSCKDKWCNWQRYIPIDQGCSLHWVTLLGPGVQGRILRGLLVRIMTIHWLWEWEHTNDTGYSDTFTWQSQILKQLFTDTGTWKPNSKLLQLLKIAFRLQSSSNSITNSWVSVSNGPVHLPRKSSIIVSIRNPFSSSEYLSFSCLVCPSPNFSTRWEKG